MIYSIRQRMQDDSDEELEKARQQADVCFGMTAESIARSKNILDRQREKILAERKAKKIVHVAGSSN